MKSKIISIITIIVVSTLMISVASGKKITEINCRKAYKKEIGKLYKKWTIAAGFALSIVAAPIALPLAKRYENRQKDLENTLRILTESVFISKSYSNTGYLGLSALRTLSKLHRNKNIKRRYHTGSMSSLFTAKKLTSDLAKAHRCGFTCTKKRNKIVPRGIVSIRKMLTARGFRKKLDSCKL